MSNPAYQILGTGGFGAVVSPALPNVNAAGNTITFGPDMVTKVMFHKRDYDKSLQDAADLQAKVPTLAIPLTPYRYQYSIRDVADGIPGMRKYITHYQPGYSGAYLVRMPNLGYSFADIEKRLSLQYSLGILPTEKIATEILKLMRVVKYIGKADYIHGDIRETNVLCNTTTGEMTIIDFDWLLKKSVYNTTYPVYFYCHPPEELYFLNGGVQLAYQINKRPDRLAFMNFIYNDIKQQLASNSAYNTFWQKNYWVRTMPQQPPKADDLFAYELMRTLTMVYDFTKGFAAGNIKARPFAEAFKHWNTKSMDTVDSFGLAVALEGPLRAALAGPKHKPLMDFLLNDLFFGMKNVFLPNRITIDEAIERFETFLRKTYPAIELGEQPDFDDELARLAAIDPSVAEKATPKPQPKHRTVAKELTAYAALVRALEGMSPEKSPLPLLPPSRDSTQSRSRGGRRRRTQKRTSGK